MSYNHVHVSHVRNDDQYPPPPGSGYPEPFPGPAGFNPGPPPPGYPGGGRWDRDGYQGYFDQGYPPPPPPRRLPHQHYNHYQRPYEYDHDYGCDSFLRRW